MLTQTVPHLSMTLLLSMSTKATVSVDHGVVLTVLNASRGALTTTAQLVAVKQRRLPSADEQSENLQFCFQFMQRLTSLTAEFSRVEREDTDESSDFDSDDEEGTNDSICGALPLNYTGTGAKRVWYCPHSSCKYQKAIKYTKTKNHSALRSHSEMRRCRQEGVYPGAQCCH